MKSIKLLALLVFSLLFVVVPVSAQDAPAFEPGECPFAIPEGFDVTCGFVTVPEARDPQQADDTNDIRIAVAVASSFSDNPEPDPVIYLEGGPGGQTLSSGDFLLQDFAPFLENRDLILFDQRGVGFSEPRLECPNVTELRYELLDDDISYEEGLEQTNTALFDCRDGLVAEGVNINAYNSAENAADVRDIISALDYEQINLFGISYGTRLGLTVMRDHPEIVRSSILDAVLPLNIDTDEVFLPYVRYAFDRLFTGCADDPLCNETYPDLENVFYSTVDRLNETPELVTYFDVYTDQEREVLVHGTDLVWDLYNLLYYTNLIPSLPDAIYQAQDGVYDQFLDETMFNLFVSQFFDEAMFHSVMCYEDANFSSTEDLLAGLEGLPPQILYATVNYPFLGNDIEFADDYLEFCAAWTGGERADAIENEAVVSDIPTLLTSGEYDPITPPADAQLAAESLSRSYLYEFPGVGHGTWFGGPCPQSIIVAFINDPTTEPDASCIAEMPSPQFVQEPLTEITLIEHTSEDLGFSGIVPEGWLEVEPGIFDFDPITQLPSLAYRFPGSIDEYVENIIFGPAYAYDALPEPVEAVETNGLMWDIYAIENPGFGIYAWFAFTTSSADDAYVIGVLSGSEEERTFFYDALLIPAIEAFTPSE